ncbi:MAG: hypothetical protein IPI03_14505 [Rubrivivax sp.]|nr:hypothetical protein [Rubrivivax sp.]MBK8529181.1 hypothetical protein [Rubrivivax sp.]
MSAVITPIRGADADDMDFEALARVCFAIAAADRQAEIVGDEVPLEALLAIGDRVGRRELAFALRVHGEILIGEANELQRMAPGAAG